MRQRTEIEVSMNRGRRKQKYREKGGSKPPKIWRTALFYSTLSIQLQIIFLWSYIWHLSNSLNYSCPYLNARPFITLRSTGTKCSFQPLSSSPYRHLLAFATQCISPKKLFLDHSKLKAPKSLETWSAKVTLGTMFFWMTFSAMDERKKQIHPIISIQIVKYIINGGCFQTGGPGKLSPLKWTCLNTGNTSTIKYSLEDWVGNRSSWRISIYGVAKSQHWLDGT